MGCRMTQHNLLVSVLLVWLSLTAFAPGVGTAAQAALLENLPDTVWLAAPQNGGGQTKLTGQILDYSGAGLRIRLTSGREQLLPSDRVARIESHWNSSHNEADSLFANHQYAAALAAYGRADEAESRVWARQRIRAQMIRSLHAMGRETEACAAFLLFEQNDPETPYLDCIPLAWLPDESVSKSQALAWLAQRDRSAATLLGASHLMSTDEREAAVAELSRLRSHKDPRIAALATAQLWRQEIARSDAETIARWSGLVESMPEALRAGPYYLLGAAQAHQKRWEDAALDWMRVPIGYPNHRQLAAASLVAAGDALAELGRRDQAIRLFREVATDYDLPKWKTEATGRLSKFEASDK